VKEEGMHVALATNGTLITNKVAKKLKDIGVDYVEISIDSAEPEQHDAFRGVSGSFNRALEGIKHCVDQEILTCVATTVTQLNLHEIPDIIDLAEKLRAQRFMAFNFIPAGRGADVTEIDLRPEQREALLKMLMNKNLSGGIQALSTAPQLARVSLQMSGGEIVAPTHMYVGHPSWDLKVLAEFIGGCGAGRLYCALQPNGDVSPCVFMPRLVVGKVRESSFSDIWEKNEVMQRLRDRRLLEGHCGNCQYKHVCGGCRARALGYFNDIMAPDPGCIRELEEPSVRTWNFPSRKRLTERNKEVVRR
jgi:radical SAM protein with 4Fe4S-binding SPASM domain